jgi:hypothetical protein
MMIRFIAYCIAIAVLSGCAGSVKKVESGPVTVGDRLTFVLEGAWNHMDFPASKPAQVWTMEGVSVDELLIYSGISDGQLLHPEAPANTKVKNFVFRSNMQLEEVIGAFEGTYSRDLSTVKVLKVEPTVFGGKKGFRFDFERVRKVDGARFSGLGFGAIDRGQLFAMVYLAPNLTFFPRHKGRIESIAKTALIK